jgi:segregation and condensation protein A
LWAALDYQHPPSTQKERTGAYTISINHWISCQRGAILLPVPATFRIERFEGPLDLLLQLVEEEKLEISNVSLANVADQFVSYVNDRPGLPLEEVADFLVIAAKLMYLKSKLLFPTFVDAEMEEGPDLAAQLRRYQQFVSASKKIEAIWNSGLRSYPRERRAIRRDDVRFAPPPSLVSDMLRDAMRKVVSRLEPLRKLPQAAVERVVSIQERIRGLFSRVKDHANTSFRSFVGHKATKAEVLITFLALLELVKQRFVRVNQSDAFQDIDIEIHPDAPASSPFAESFV